MLRKLILLVCLFGTASAIAQKPAPAPPKTTEKPADPAIDYKQPGAPMPQILFIAFHDTTTKSDEDLGLNKKDATAAERRTARKKKKQQDEEKKSPGLPQLITNKDLENDANLFIMMFNPTCSHCEDETAMLEKNIGLFKKSKVVLVANNIMKPYLPGFVQMLHVADYPKLFPCIDSTGFIDKVFLYQALPQINIYDRQRKLIRAFAGEVAIDSLKKYIE